jgi:HTH-type transcriptional regulator / antitoxin HigA
MKVIREHARRRTPSPAVSDEYLELVRRFPLRPIRTGDEMQDAGELLDRYVGRDDLTAGESDYVAALAHFVHEYERRTVGATLRRLKPVDLLKHLMAENCMNTSDLGAILGSRGLASEVLNGKRGLSKTLIAKLARRFRVDPALFLDVSEGER